MLKLRLAIIAPLAFHVAACGAPPEPVAPVEAPPPVVAEPIAVEPAPLVEEPAVVVPTPRERPCAELMSCLKACEGCDDAHRAQAEKVTTACAKQCPVIKVVKRKVTVADALWGFTLGSSISAAQSRCTEIKGIWSPAPEAVYEGNCQAAIGAWGVPVDVLISAINDKLIRIELVYAFAEGETAAALLPLFGTLIQQSLGAPTYQDKGKRPQYSWMSGTGGSPYRALLLDAEQRKASIWVQNEK